MDARKWLGRARSINREIEGLLEEKDEARARNEELKKQSDITAYTIKEVKKTKKSGHPGLSVLRPKGGKK